MDERRVVMATSRGTGAIGTRAIVPRIVAGLAFPGQRVLDFGCGRQGIHVAWLRGLGVDVCGYDFSLPDTFAHIREPLRYDVVAASNVLNVAVSHDMLERTVRLVADLVDPRGRAVCNYPVSPRKAGLCPDAVAGVLGAFFGGVSRVGVEIAGGNIVWSCVDPRSA